ncbi:BspA family leucine-rich repeat surface protein [Maribacter dokdonensis]|uniref:BspA family leucine-rich repeat surface protein n=1 Tax=Maribacter dokdonensis TaxID=320912 RepID=UPI001C097824|nr:BspA family leucine-rich repeat surface protein [Maribacter dokdonensis]MBU2902895.1 BspA family leucine-rich repeat surface protein [Maribacter dokdonensis]
MKNSYKIFFFSSLFFLSNLYSQNCKNYLSNENQHIILPSGEFVGGIDDVIGSAIETNNSVCAINVVNYDNNEPWARYHLSLKLSDFGLVPGDELRIGVDGKNNSGYGRVEVNQNNRPNTSLIAQNFTNEWSRVEHTLIVPVVETLDIWLFSNYNQPDSGSVYYDNLLIEKVENFRPFITTWKTDNSGFSESNQIIIPTFEGEAYNYNVNWGDGSSSTNITGDGRHTYAVPGSYTISISGDFPRIFFDGSRSVSKDFGKLISIDQWGDVSWSSMASAFDGCYNLNMKAEDIPDLNKVTNLENMFISCSSLKDNESWNKWETGTITRMNGMFFVSNFNSSIGNWDVSKVESMQSMFKLSPYNQSIGDWDVGNVTTMAEMFGDTPFNQDISTWDVSKVVSMSDMFKNSTFDQNISDWNISNLEDAEFMFQNSKLSSTNYDLLLIGWSRRSNLNNAVNFNAGNSSFCVATDARQKLIADFKWVIKDAGEKCPIDFTNAFVTTWKTDNEGISSPNQITIPVKSNQIYNYSVDWGDDSISENVSGSITHTYASPGIYTVSIVGDFPQIYFNNLYDNISDSNKIILVNQWGANEWRSMESAFSGCENLDITASDMPNFSLVNNMFNMFGGAKSLVFNASINDWDTANVRQMGQLFYLAENFDQPIGKWNVANVRDMTNMFGEAKIFNQDIGEWNTNNVVFMTAMFANAKLFNQNISNWNTDNVYSMSSMFNGTEQFNQNIGDWQLENVTELGGIFYNAKSFNQDISKWNISNAVNLGGAFYGASSFDQDLSQWNISNVEYMYDMFNYSALSTENYDAILIGWSQLPVLQSNINLGARQTGYCDGEGARQLLIDMYNWSINDNGLARNCGIEKQTSFITTWKTDNPGISGDNQITIPTYKSYSWEETLVYDYTVDWGDGTVDENVSGDITHNYDTPGTYAISISGEFPRIYFTNYNDENDSQKILTVEQWGNYGWSSMRGAFYECINLDVVAVDIPNLTWVEDISEMFYGCNSLVGNDTFEQWDTSNVKDMYGVFRNAAKFNQPLSAWNVEKVRTFYHMFDGATQFDQPLGHWDLKSAFGISAMFKDTAFNQDISNWNVSNVEYMSELFKGNTKFNQDISSWDVSSVKDMNGVFHGATAFNQDITSWDVSKVESMYYLFYGASSFNQNIGTWNVSLVAEMFNMLNYSGITNQNYDNILLGWSQLPSLNNDISFGAIDKRYCQSAQARANIKAIYGWNFYDMGKSLSCDVSDERAFITTWNVSSANNNEVIIPIHNEEVYGYPIVYNYTVNWGDGTIDSNITESIGHSYSTAGEYQIEITGLFPRIDFSQENSKSEMILSIDQWGDIEWSTMQYAFANCSNLDVLAKDVPNLSNVSNTSNMFLNCTSLIGNSKFNEWDVSALNNMESMFKGTTAFNQFLSKWDTSSVNNMNEMFFESGFAKSLGKWDIGQVTSMTQMFTGARLTTLNYDATLVGWSRLQGLQQNVIFDAGLSTYCKGEDAKQVLVDTYNWTIYDNGKVCPEQNAFVTTWRTDNLGKTNDNEISLPVWGGPYTVDWGDGTIETELYGEQIHSYESPGIYTVSILGELYSFNFNSYPRNYSFSDSEKILEINQWGQIQWGYLNTAFSGCTNLDITAIDAPVLSNITEMRDVFAYCTSLTGNASFNDWDVSAITDMTQLFYGCNNFNADISDWDVAKVTSMTNLFANNLMFNQNLSNWNVAKVTDMGWMFSGAQSFDKPIGNWNVSSVTDMSGMFQSSNFNHDISEWNVSNVDKMNYMFGNSSSFDQDISSWNVSKVTEMIYMFGFSAFNQDISSWNIINVVNMESMFLNTPLSKENYDKLLIGWSKLPNLQAGVKLGASQNYCASKNERQELIDTYGWIIIDAGENCPLDFANAFVTTWKTDNIGVSANNQITIPTSGVGSYNYSVDWGDGVIEFGFTGDATHTYSNVGTYTVSIIGEFPNIYFNGVGDKDKILTVEKWGDNKWQDFSSVFKGCTNLDVNTNDVPNTDSVYNYQSMFQDCKSLVGNSTFGDWDVGNSHGMAYMFAGTELFNQSISNWVLGTTMSLDGMFENAISFNQPLNFRGMDRTPTMVNMLNGAISFNQDLSQMPRSGSNMAGMLVNSGMSNENYEKTLIGWSTQSNSLNVVLDAPGNTFCISEEARQTLIDDFGWSINDGGENCPLVECQDDILNEDLSIILPSGILVGGVDTALGTEIDTNGSECALIVGNVDNGQPWGRYHIAINLVDYGISVGDDLLIGIDGKNLTGNARIEVNRNNQPNTAIISHNFNNSWSRYENTFTVTSELSTIDIWLFSNYSQSSSGEAIYDNLVVRNLSNTGENNAPIANAGNNIEIEDDDFNGMETVLLNASNSVDFDGSLVSYVWTENETIIANGIAPEVSLNLGVHEIELTVTDNGGLHANDTVIVSVLEPFLIECGNELVNENENMILGSGTLVGGVDHSFGTAEETNNSQCAVIINNVDSGQPWGRYHLEINLLDYGIEAGDEIFVGVDGKNITGNGRIEINRNNFPNTALGAKTFNDSWSRYETSFIVPSGLATIDLWFFSNYGQQTSGSAVYDNLEVSLLTKGDLSSGKSLPVLEPFNDLNIFPNPASIETILSFDQSTMVGEIQIFDVTGRLVQTIKGGPIDDRGLPISVRDMPEGVYFVKTTDTAGVEFQQKMLIQRQ